jgi:hypothetical protein
MKYGRGRKTPLIKAARGEMIDATNRGTAKDARQLPLAASKI